MVTNQIVKFIVSETSYKTTVKSIQNYPQTELAKLVSKSECNNDAEIEIFIDADHRIFEAFLSLYRYRILKKPETVDLDVFEKAIEQFGLSDYWVPEKEISFSVDLRIATSFSDLPLLLFFPSIDPSVSPLPSKVITRLNEILTQLGHCKSRCPGYGEYVNNITCFRTAPCPSPFFILEELKNALKTVFPCIKTEPIISAEDKYGVHFHMQFSMTM